MQNQDTNDIFTTVSYDRKGNIIEVRNKYGNKVEGKSFEGVTPEGGRCPEGETKITAVKEIEIVYVTCANTNDPCWVYDPILKRWFYEC